jgi:hypothetical protein
MQATSAEAPHDHVPETFIIRGKTVMRNVLGMLTLLLLAAATCAFAEDVRPGDQVRFVKRDQHIPASPAPAIHACICAWSAAPWPRSCT